MTSPDEVLLSSCAVADAMGTLGLRHTISTVSAVSAGHVAIGPAFTVHLVESGSGAFNDYLPTVPPGAVVVIDAGGRTDVSAWGGLASAEAKRIGVRATVINGACRDANELGTIGYQVFAASTTPQSGRGVLSSDGVAVPLVIEGVPVHPGDLVVADADGAVVVPRGRADEVLSLARRIAAKDEAMHELIRSGTALHEARRSLA